MSEAWRILRGGEANILIVGDHASAHVPDDIDLGIDPALLRNHIAIDIGVAEVAALLVEALGCTAIDAMTDPFILSLHSFTPHLAANPEEQRPWDIGVLYNDDDRGARIAIPLLREAGLNVGDQLPYSGKLLNATMNRHAEGNGIPYLGVEMRQDLIGEAPGQARFAGILAPVVRECRDLLS